MSTWDMAGGNLMNGESWNPTDEQISLLKRKAHTIEVARLAHEIANYGYGLAGIEISKAKSEQIDAWSHGVAEGIVTAAELTWEKK